MANAYFYSNIAVPTTLSGNINNTIGTCTVADTTGWPTSYPFIISLDFNTANEELVKVTNNAAGTLTITRGFGSTTAVSHSSGAAVRHVLNAVDFTDFRTHEGATSGAHGITGSFVGTSDTQTLTNKTLTAPTVNNGTYASGGSFAGTFTGTPTFSGAVVFSGTPSFTAGASLDGGTYTGTPTFSGNLTFSGSPIFSGTAQFNSATSIIQFTKVTTAQVALGAQISGDTFDRYRLFPDGAMEWGTGATTRDTFLYRSAAKILGTTSSFRTEPTDTALDGLMVNLPTSTTGDMLNLRVNSAIQAAMDSSGNFRIYQGNSPSTYIPTWGNAGTAAFSSNTGTYWRLGKVVFVTVYAVVSTAGSGTGNLTVTMPTNVSRATRQCLTVHSESNGPGGSHLAGGEVVFFVGGSGAVADRIRWDDNSATNNEASVQGQDLLVGGIITIQGWYREA